jgi:hypothetical protein
MKISAHSYTDSENVSNNQSQLWLFLSINFSGSLSNFPDVSRGTILRNHYDAFEGGYPAILRLSHEEGCRMTSYRVNENLTRVLQA